MISVVLGELAAQTAEGVMRPIRSDLAPATAAARDVAQGAGEAVAARLEKVGAVPIGGAVITPAGALDASFLIHVVVMSADEPQTAIAVQRALNNGLRRAADLGLESLALPPLGLGVGAMEPEEAGRAQVEILANHLAEGAPPLDVTIVAASEFELELFERLVANAEA